MIKYSKKLDTCFDTSLVYSNVPDDLVEITKEEHLIFMGGKTPEGKVRETNTYPFKFKDVTLETLGQKEKKNKADKFSRKLNTMLIGSTYEGILYSLTSEDNTSILQAKFAFDLGVLETCIDFKNGTTLLTNPIDFIDFATWFVTERNKILMN